MISQKIDYRIVAAASLAPDLIDKPFGLLYPNLFGNNTRLAAHTWIAAAAVGLISLWLSKRSKGREKSVNIKLFAFGYFLHDVLDFLLLNSRDLQIFLYPFLGSVAAFETPAVERWKRFYENPYTMCGEVMGFVILLILFLKYRLNEKEKLTAFFKTGKLIPSA